MNARVALALLVGIAVTVVLLTMVSFDPQRAVQQFTPTASAPQPGVCGRWAEAITTPVPKVYTSGMATIPWTYIRDLGALPACQGLWVSRLPGGYKNCVQVASPDFRGWRWYDEPEGRRVRGEKYFPTARDNGGTLEIIPFDKSSYHTRVNYDLHMVVAPDADMRIVAIPGDGGCPPVFD